MRSLAVTAFRYRWELWLFLGIPLLTELASRLYYGFPISYFLRDVLSQGAWLGVSRLIVALPAIILLWVSYHRVLQLQRPVLRLLLGLSLASAVIQAVVHIVFLFWFSLDTLSGLGLSQLYGYWLWLLVLVHLVVVVWFARQATAAGFRNGVLLIALATALEFGVVGEIFDFVQYAKEFDKVLESAAVGLPGVAAALVVLTVLGVALYLLAARELAHADSGGIPRVRPILILFGLATVVSWPVAVLYWAMDSDSILGILVVGVPSMGYQLVFWALIVALTYALRFRRPATPLQVEAEVRTA